jgi:hypothetical protein
MTYSDFPATLMPGWRRPHKRRQVELNNPEFAGGSNFQIAWSLYEQNDEQILS